MITGKISLCMLALMASLVEFRSSPDYTASTLQCTAVGHGDIVLMRARFEATSSGRRTFSTEFEARPGRAFSAGQKMIVVVAEVKVGTVKLKPIVGGDVLGEMQLNDGVSFGDHTKPFPSDFPQVERNTSVAFKMSGKTILSCQLE
jgi:hypothetical protein